MNPNPFSGPFGLYQVGNSLTNDSVPDAYLAADMAATLATGYHIRSGSGLVFIVANPNDVTLELGGVWDVALPAVVRNFFPFEPYPQFTNTTLQEQMAFMTLVASVESGPSVDPRYFVYCAWPGITECGGDYTAYFNEPVPNTDGTLVVLKKQFFYNFYDRILAQRSNTFIVPIGMVMEAFDREAKAGRVPDGVTSVFDLYRDDLHLGDAGHFLAACTKMSTLLRRAPQSTAVTRNRYRLNHLGAKLTDQMADYIERLVWRALSTEPRSGVPQS